MATWRQLHGSTIESGTAELTTDRSTLSGKRYDTVTSVHRHDGGREGHDHTAELRGSSRRSLLVALALISGFTVAEVIGGLMSGSLALLADAGHMLTDAAAISLALLALWVAGQPASIGRTFGYHRTEVLAAMFNALSLWAIAAWITFEAIRRLSNASDISIEGGLMTIVGGIGLVVNIAAAFVLRRGAKRSLNVEGAFKHVMADLMGSVAVVISALVVMATGWVIIDPILSLLIAGLIVFSSRRLVWKTVNVLLEGTPEHIDLYRLCGDLEAVEGVTLVHDVHVWTISSNYDSLTAHVLIDPSHQRDADELLDNLRRIAREKYRIHHVTLQLDKSLSDCDEDHHLGHLVARARSGG